MLKTRPDKLKTRSDKCGLRLKKQSRKRKAGRLGRKMLNNPFEEAAGTTERLPFGRVR